MKSKKKPYSSYTWEAILYCEFASTHVKDRYGEDEDEDEDEEKGGAMEAEEADEGSVVGSIHPSIHEIVFNQRRTKTEHTYTQ